MTRARIVMLDFAEHDLAPADWDALGALARSLVRCRSVDPELPTHLRGAEVLLVQLGVQVTPAMLDVAPRLRYLGVFGTSLGRIDPEAARRGIVIRNVPGFSTEAVAELAIALTLDHLRDVSGARARAARGDLSEGTSLDRELRGLRFGVVGLGAIGARVAAIARHGFGADVCAWSRTPRPELGIPAVSLDALLADCDVLSVHVALTPETRGLLHADRVARVREDALLVHLSPPELLDVPALLARLRAGTLYFATDHGDEMAESDLDALRQAKATLLPPIGYATREATASRRAGFVGALAAFLDRHDR